MIEANNQVSPVKGAKVEGDTIDARVPDIELRLDSGDGSLTFGLERFDSDILGLKIGRIFAAQSAHLEGYCVLLHQLVTRIKPLAYDQVLRRVPTTHSDEIWALERAGFELMDVGLTFGRDLSARLERPTSDDLTVRLSTDDDIRQVVDEMLDVPWGSRYETDPAYSPAVVKQLRATWLWNSHRGRAAAVFIGDIGGRPAGYVTCLLNERSRHGEIELVGTLPTFRGRRVASRIIEHALGWFSAHSDRVTVRTQATNFAAAALYEKLGFTLVSSDLTFRLSVHSDSNDEVL
jgi:ribosomal protein S18 acetylase RimI-like enzyme